MKIFLFANTDWYLYNFRLPLAKFIREKGAEVVFISPHGPYVDKIVEEGFRWIFVPMKRRSLNPLWELYLLLYLIKIYRFEKPDLTHHFTIKAVVYGSIATKIAKIRCCVNAITGLGFVFSSKSIMANFIKPSLKNLFKVILCFRHSVLILQNPDDLHAFVSEKIVRPERIRIIRGSGVDTSLFRPLKRSSKPNKKIFKIILPARLIKEKGVYDYIETARILLKEKKSQVAFFVAGKPDEGNPNSIEERIIVGWEKEGLIRYLGHVENMSELLSEMDCIVLPTYYGEGVPRILIEGASCGIPIVATNVAGCREIVKHGVNGVLVPTRNSSAMANAIRYLMHHPQECVRMGKEGRRLAVTEFDEKLVLESTYSVYKELLCDLQSNYN
jgi:glycosyltransferase involved in cell wall biosynthesis